MRNGKRADVQRVSTCRVFPAGATQTRQSHGRELLAAGGGNTRGLPAPSLRAVSRISMARAQSGTRCSRFIFMRVAGMIQTRSAASAKVGMLLARRFSASGSPPARAKL